jgi:hypothetical protein
MRGKEEMSQEAVIDKIAKMAQVVAILHSVGCNCNTYSVTIPQVQAEYIIWDGIQLLYFPILFNFSILLKSKLKTNNKHSTAFR